MLCPGCNCENPQGAKFCAECGMSFDNHFPLAAVVAIVLLLPLAANVVFMWFCCLRADRPWDVSGPAQVAIHVQMAAPGHPPLSRLSCAAIRRGIPLWACRSLSCGALDEAVRFGPARAAQGRPSVDGLRYLCGLRPYTPACMALRRKGRARDCGFARLCSFAPAGALGFRVSSGRACLASELGALALFQSGLIPLAVAFSVAAFFTKQMRLAAIGAMVLYSWLTGKRKSTGSVRRLAWLSES